jgi:hypothetical protein
MRPNSGWRCSACQWWAEGIEKLPDHYKVVDGVSEQAVGNPERTRWGRCKRYPQDDKFPGDVGVNTWATDWCGEFMQPEE